LIAFYKFWIKPLNMFCFKETPQILLYDTFDYVYSNYWTTLIPNCLEFYNWFKWFYITFLI
jgi:hypothetical protein